MCEFLAAQVPETVAFAILAGLEPSKALHSAWIVGLIMTIFGGKPGLMGGATGGMVNEHTKWQEQEQPFA